MSSYIYSTHSKFIQSNSSMKLQKNVSMAFSKAILAFILLACLASTLSIAHPGMGFGWGGNGGMGFGWGGNGGSQNGGGPQVGGGSQIGGGSQVGGGSQNGGGFQNGGGTQNGAGSQVGGGSQNGGGSQIGGGSQVGGGSQNGGGFQNGGGSQNGAGSQNGGGSQIGGGSQVGGGSQNGGGFQNGGGSQNGAGSQNGGGWPYSSLYPQFYEHSCPQASDIVMSVLHNAIAKEPRMAASLLRLHFHDCFVQGCDASILLDDSATIVSEKNSGPNKNSIRGFHVIDEIKAKLEEKCPHTVSCADTLALAARGSIVLSGGPSWELPLGRKDSRTASLSLSNNNIPAPNSTIQNLISLFNRQGLDEVDLVSLSGGHTIGVARCVTFKQRLYNQNGNNQPDATLERGYYYGLKSVCPKSGGDGNIFPLDLASPAKFDNTYFKLILWGKGLLTSDEVLLTGKAGQTAQLVKNFAQDESLFFTHFAKSMVKMGNISPLTGFNGEVRKNCRHVN